MAAATGVAKLESSEDDSVSLTSTVVSDGDGVDYNVDSILAERENNGVIEYLTRWEGYLEEQSTWQEKKDFHPTEGGGDRVFKEWQEKKMRISRGYEEPFDIDDWKSRRENLAQETYARRERRKTKKARLDNFLKELSSSSDSEDKDGNNSKLRSRAKGSASSSSSSNSSENEDSQFIGEILDATRADAPWTDLEKRVFIKGLQDTGGPQWDRILKRYGPHGEINDVLKNKAPEDLQKQLLVLVQEFTAAGRKPPLYMKAENSHARAEPPRTPTIQSHPQDKVTLTRIQTSDNEQNPSRPGTDVNINNLDAELTRKDNESATQPRRKANTLATLRGEASDPRFSALCKAQTLNTSSFRPVLEPCHPTGLAKTYSGTARPIVQNPNKSKKPPHISRTGASTLGPDRLSAVQPNKKVEGRLPKAQGSEMDVTAKRSVELKQKKARSLATTNTRASVDDPIKMFKTLGARNRNHKRQRNEPAPDPSQLVLVNPKTDKAAKNSPSSLAIDENTAPMSKVSSRRYQQHLIEKEPNDQIHRLDHTKVNDIDEALFVDDGIVDNIPISDVVEADARMTSAYNFDNPDVPTRNPHSGCRPPIDVSQTPAPPLNAPAAPRALLESISRLDRQHPFPDRVKSAKMVNSRERTLQSRSEPLESGSFVLRSNTTLQEKKDLFSSYDPDLVNGHFRIGPTLKPIGKMRLVGFQWQTKRKLLKLVDRNDSMQLYFDFDQICTATDYLRYWHVDAASYEDSGYVVPHPESDAEYDLAAEVLAALSSAGLFFARDFTMVLWPTKASAWDFLEKSLPKVPPGAMLKFALRPPVIPDPTGQPESPAIARLRCENPTICNDLSSAIRERPSRSEIKHINLVFRDIFGIEFDRLLPSRGNEEQFRGKNFFLCFVPAGCEKYEPDDTKRQALRLKIAEEHDFFVQFLQANGGGSIYSMQELGSSEAVSNGSWRYFIENVTSGAIIIHERCGRPDQLPYFAKFLSYRENEIKVWLTSLTPMDREGEDCPHLIRYFPHGGVVLITISLILYRPFEALRILRWFRLEQLPGKFSGTWKVAVRPRIREWLLDLHDICCEKTRKSPFGDFTLQVYADIYTEILLLLERSKEPFGLLAETWDNEVPLPEAPIVADVRLPRGQREWTGSSFETAEIDHTAIRWNDEELIQWFSEWASTRLHDHRKFHVVLGYPKGEKDGDYVLKCYERGYGYLDDGPEGKGRQARGLFKREDGTQIRNAWERNLVEILPYDKFFTRHKIPEQAVLDKKEEQRRQKEKAALTRLEAESEAEWKKERSVAKKTLETIMKIEREKGGSEEQSKAAGRRHLLFRRDEQGMASDQEVANCAIDMMWKPFNPYFCMIAKTQAEQEAVLQDLQKEKKRLADKERLSGSKEQQIRWQTEIRMLAIRDQASHGHGR